jgi:GDP-L-fucose synthase
MESTERILLFGKDGFVGSSLFKELSKHDSFLGLNRKNLDISNYLKVKEVIQDFRPTIVINATGKVAGIQGNIDFPVSLMRDNSENILSITKACHELKVNRMIQFASACIYPLNEIDSSKPTDLGTGIIEQTSKGYATSKIFAIELFNSYRKEFGYNWSTIVPTNLYGVGDWTTNSSGHVIAMLVTKFLAAKREKSTQVEVWGDGLSLRNFLNVSDLADATTFFISNNLFDNEVLNVSGEREVSIAELAVIIKEATQYNGELIFDKTKPNGARRKMLNDEVIRSLGWTPKISLERGILDYIKKLENLVP